jgi:hypothetical protein
MCLGKPADTGNSNSTTRPSPPYEKPPRDGNSLSAAIDRLHEQQRASAQRRSPAPAKE